MNFDRKLLMDAEIPAVDRRHLAGAVAVVLLLLGIGLASTVTWWVVVVVATLTSIAFAAMLWPAGKDEQKAVTWWNRLSVTERQKWISQGGAGHRDAWEAFKRSESRK